jgi:transcriptional regulator with XRE-family HTH domain
LNPPLSGVCYQNSLFVEAIMPPKKVLASIAEIPPLAPQAASLERAQSLTAIASELVAARERAGLSISELHRRTGISRTVLQGYEKGRFAPGSIELKKLCETLGISPNRVVFGTENPLEKKSWLGGTVTDLKKPINTARITILLQILTLSEQDAFITLLSSIATARVGGEEEMKLAMEAIEAVFEGAVASEPQLEKFAKEMIANLPGEKLLDIEARAGALKKRKARRG